MLTRRVRSGWGMLWVLKALGQDREEQTPSCTFKVCFVTFFPEKDNGLLVSNSTYSLSSQYYFYLENWG